jgi:hypothetical protein
MSNGLTIRRPIWITIWIVAILQTLVGGIAPTEGWRIDIQFPGIMVALLLQWVIGPIALMFGASGGVFVAAASILTNVLIYAALVSLTLLVINVFRKES